MTIRWLRILIAAIVAEIIPIVLLVALVAIFGPNDAAETQDYASSLDAWVGPLGGALHFTHSEPYCIGGGALSD